MLRGKVELAVERLLAVLDEIDGDPDLEPDEDADDTERGEHDTADAEPWLASPEQHQDQRQWAAGVENGVAE